MKKIFLVFGFFILFGACTTSKGTLINESIGTDNSSSSGRESKGNEGGGGSGSSSSSSSTDISVGFFTQTSGAEDAGIYFSSSPDGARVYVDGAYIGKTPVSFSPATGSYRVTMEKTGYHSSQQWINYTAGTVLDVFMELNEITGFVHITTEPDDAKCSVGLTGLSQGVNELKVGSYTLTVRRFGFEEETAGFAVSENNTTYVHVSLEKAAFRMDDLIPRREVFSPENPGLLGKAVVNFEVSTYGTGEYSIEDETGRERLKGTMPRFTDFKQEIVWDGKDSAGERVPDGIYTLRVRGTAEESGEVIEKSLTLTLDSRAVIRYGNTFSGNSGLLYAPTADVLPRYGFSTGVSLIGAVTGGSGIFPLHLGIRYGSAPNLETVFQGTIILRDPTEDIFAVSLAAKYTVLGPAVSRHINIALTAKGTATDASGIDPLTNYAGLSFGIPVTFRFGYLGLTIDPEVTLSPFSPDAEGSSDLSFNAWGYGRAGLFFDMGTFMAGFSLALPTEAFDQGFGLRLPFSAGIEAHWLIPGTQIYLSGLVAAQIRASDDYYFMGGGGFSFLN